MATIDACSPTVPPSGPGLHPTQQSALARAQLCKNSVECKHVSRRIYGAHSYTPVPLMPSVDRAQPDP